MARHRVQARSSEDPIPRKGGSSIRARGESLQDEYTSADPVAPGESSTTTPSPVGARPKKKVERGPAGAALEWLLMLLLLLYVCFLVNVYHGDILPAPLSKQQAGARGFSEEKGREHVTSLTEFGPHPVGSDALNHALMYVYSELIEIKDAADAYVHFEVDLFQPRPGLERLSGALFNGKSLVYANLKHLVVRISPGDILQSKENAILVSSHIDTVITSPGAGDCSSCVAVMLELARALSHWASGFKHSVILLFNTGEEEGLIGAHSFMTQHPWSSTIRAAIDVESLGTGGRSTLFQAGPNRWLLDLYSSVAKHPAAQILAQDVFYSGLVKSATDFQVYREIGGLSGLDFAYMENGGVYHTKNDKIEFLRAGSLQNSGDDLLAVLKAAAISDELEFVRTNYSGFEKLEMVYFDILGKWMVSYPQSTVKAQQISLIFQGLVLLIGSLYLSGYSAFLEFGLALVAMGLTWIFAVAFVMIVAAVLPFMSAFPTPYIAHPWLVVGLFGAPAVFGALVGHALGRYILIRYLKKEGHTEEHIQWHSERWLFKAGIFQWLVVLALGTWFGAGSSYIAVFWILPPTIAYALLEAQFSPRQNLRGLLRGTMWLSIAAGVVMSAVPFIRLTAVLIGNLVRFDRNPGDVPLWTANAVTGVLIASFTYLVLVYLLPYAHRSGGLVWILVALTAVFLSAILLVITQLVPAFTEHVGRGIQAVHVIDTTGFGGTNENPHQYISLSAVTPGKFEKEITFLEAENFICGQSSVDFVSFKVKYGCKKLLDGHENLSRERPTLQIEKDKYEHGQRVTYVRFNTGSSYRWTLAINTSAVHAIKLKTLLQKEGEEKVLIPPGVVSGVDGWHNVQFIADPDFSSDFQLALYWHPSSKEETYLKWGIETLLLKLRTDVDVVTDELDIVLKKLPVWCSLFGKSTSPYALAYLANLKVPPLPS